MLLAHHFLQPEMLMDGAQSGWCDQPLNRFIYNYRSGLSFVEANLGIKKSVFKKKKSVPVKCGSKDGGAGDLEVTY